MAALYARWLMRVPGMTEEPHSVGLSNLQSMLLIQTAARHTSSTKMGANSIDDGINNVSSSSAYVVDFIHKSNSSVHKVKDNFESSTETPQAW